MVRAILACLLTGAMTFLMSQTQAQDQDIVSGRGFDDVLGQQVFVTAEDEDEEEDEEEAYGEEGEENDDGLEYEVDSSVLIAKSEDFDMTGADYTIVARIRTEESGSIFSKAPRTGRYSEDGKALFVAEGCLAFDIGFVGAVMSQREVADGDWHDVAMTFDRDAGTVRLFVDGKLDAEEELAPTAPVEGHVVRIGFTTPDFPDEGRGFIGQISRIAFFQRALSADEIPKLTQVELPADGLVADWRDFDHDADILIDASGKGHNGSLEDMEIWEDEGAEEEEEYEEDEDDEDE